MEHKTCAGTTKAGKRCRLSPQKTSRFCHIHKFQQKQHGGNVTTIDPIDLLSFVGKFYRGIDGYSDETEEVFDPEMRNNTDIPVLREIFKEGGVKISGLPPNAPVDRIRPNGTYALHFNDSYLENTIGPITLPFNQIIVKNTQTWSSGHPSDWPAWYLDDGMFEDYPWIHVDEHLKSVSIKADEKGEPLTIDDVLVGSRALMFDPYRAIRYGYKIISRTSTKLILDAGVDSDN